MSFVFVVLITTVVFASLMLLLSRLRTPSYRVDAEDMVTLLVAVREGQASEHEWHLLMASPIRHDERLEVARRRCVGLERQFWQGGELLFQQQGLTELQVIEDRLRVQFQLKHAVENKPM